jgi:hypothetical protein
VIGGSKLSFFFFFFWVPFNYIVFSHQKNSMVWNMDSQHDSALIVADTLKMKMMRWISDRSYVNLAR